MEIAGKGALVTGAAKRIGRAIALALAERGADVVVHYHRSEAAAHETARAIEALGVRALVLPADLANVREIERLIERAADFLGRLDILVNNASVFFRTPFGSTTEEEWDVHLDVNLKAPFFCAQYAARIMQKQGGGKIINIADWAGFRPYVGYIPYCISKAGVIALTQSWRGRWRQRSWSMLSLPVPSSCRRSTAKRRCEPFSLGRRSSGLGRPRMSFAPFSF